ncbi:Small GTPase superfamily [Carpediemonas membranifera]|uniref:Small GTPase superfamily n=1 Tax=Carpediemonas membranifera TaxID=201153 RepID=A0A8J6B2X6_9EUKA|nr:Small GTPase superfamily [Carpediemonas membranifera]|eukprot:KAG9391799.1 Small GTPase superfamily [Carpediemonas membranifera]
MDNAINFKFILVGEYKVGKTSYVKAMMKQAVDEQYKATVGADMTFVTKEISGHPVKINLWDIAGQLKYVSMRSTFYRSASAAIIMHSLAPEDMSTAAAEIKGFVDSIRTETAVELNDGTEDKIPIFVVGNKSDLQLADGPTPQELELQEQLAEHGIAGYYKTSALTMDNIDESFDRMAEFVFEYYAANDLLDLQDDTGIIDIRQPASKSGAGCLGILGLRKRN